MPGKYRATILRTNRIILTTLVLGCVLNSTQAQTTGRSYVTFDLVSGDKKTAVTAASVTPANDKKAMDLPRPAGFCLPPETRRQQTLEKEAGAYGGTSLTLAPDNLNVNGFNIGANVPSSRLNCAGLAFARLLGGPLNLAPAEGLKIAETFGTKIEKNNVRAGDVLFWRDQGGQLIQHFAIVHNVAERWVPASRIGPVKTIEIVSKDDLERVYVGPVGGFPAEYKSLAAQPVYYRIDWNKIKVTRRSPPPVTPPSKNQYFVVNNARMATLLVARGDRIMGGDTPVSGPCDSIKSATEALLKLIEPGTLSQGGGGPVAGYHAKFRGKPTGIGGDIDSSLVNSTMKAQRTRPITAKK